STTTKDFKRASAYSAYIAPVKAQRSNLTVEFGAHAHRLILDGTKAVGVEYTQGGATKQARAGREVVVSMGPLNSPKLLLLSGIGPAAQPKPPTAPAVLDLPGVGENLQDHLNVRMCWESKIEQQIPMIICESSMFGFT